METQETLIVPVTRDPDDINIEQQVATGHIDGRPYAIFTSLDMRHLTIFIDNHEAWRIDLAELAFAVRKRADTINAQGRTDAAIDKMEGSE